MAMGEAHKAELVARHGYVPGDLRSMAEGIVARAEAATGRSFTLLPERPPGPGETEGDAARRARHRMWKLELGEWELSLELSGFDIHAFSENRSTGEKDGLGIRGSDFEGMAAFLSNAAARAVAEAPAAPGPR